MSAFVVDVNVAIVANGNQSPQADIKCRSACMAMLQEIVENGVVVLDDGMRILNEYMSRLSLRGQPCVGDLFMKWVWENQAVENRCERVCLAPIENAECMFQEFPDDPALQGFDRSDRMYVAVARASQKKPAILNAVDTDWWEHRVALKRNGVRLRFLCPQHMHGKSPVP
jgi:hypothetical protein